VKTITLAAAKGGVGKTTLATALAVAAVLEAPTSGSASPISIRRAR
jgi:MinD-like ATPase involved in chromosome partitioning or flagellar assembly